MYGSPAPPLPKDLNLPYPLPLPFGCGGGQRKEEAATSDILRRHQQQQQQEQMSSGLLRFRSAPSSLFAEAMEDFLHVRPSSPETDSMMERFLAQPGLRGEFRDKPSAGDGPRNSQLPLAPASQPAPQMIYHSQQQQQQQMPNHGAIDGVAYGVVGSMAMENRDQINSVVVVVAGSSNLVRQSSSPAGIFSQLNEENGYDVLNGMGGLRNANGSIGDVGSRLKGQMSFSSRQNAFMSQISEMRSDGMGGSSPVDSGCAAGRSHLPGFPVTSWEHTSSLLSQSSFPGLKGGIGEGEGKLMVDPSEAQNAGPGNPVAGLAHQFSLPEKTSSEKFLQFQDTVPCKFRAKRGCATHPRSVAERVRRTKISERMRNLQELVPNMDKQTTTSDMLDLAVDYIKDLQMQVEALMERRPNCTCSAGNNKHES